MKKIIILLMVVLMIASVAYAQKKMKITPKDLAGLKGTWEGTIGFGITEGATSPCTLEILNDAVPVKAKLTIRNVPEQVAAITSATAGQNVMENDQGVITSQGSLLFVGAQKNFIELTLTAKNKFSAWYIFGTVKGEGSLTKK